MASQESQGGSDPVIRHRVVVALPRSEVWPLWTTSEGLTTWLVEHARVELRLGGPFEVHFDRSQPPGKQGSEGCVVQSWLHERMLSFTWNAPPSLPTRDGPATFVVVELADADGGTEVVITHGGWPADGLTDPDSAWSETFAYFERAWGMVCKALASHGGEVGPPTVQGLGGAFLYARDPAALAAWYGEHLGLQTQNWGESHGIELPSADRVPAGRMATTTLAFMAYEGELPAARTGRVNLRVHDLDAVEASLAAVGVTVEKRMGGYGRFLQVRDPEHNLLELWEPEAVG